MTLDRPGLAPGRFFWADLAAPRQARSV